MLRVLPKNSNSRPLLQTSPRKLHSRLPAQRKTLRPPLLFPLRLLLLLLHLPHFLQNTPHPRVTLLKDTYPPHQPQTLMVRHPLLPPHLLLQELPAVPMETVEHLQRLQLRISTKLGTRHPVVSKNHRIRSPVKWQTCLLMRRMNQSWKTPHPRKGFRPWSPCTRVWLGKRH